MKQLLVLIFVGIILTVSACLFFSAKDLVVNLNNKYDIDMELINKLN